MLWDGAGIKDVFLAIIGLMALVFILNDGLRWAGWRWFSRWTVLLPVLAVIGRFVYRLLNSTILIF